MIEKYLQRLEQLSIKNKVDPILDIDFEEIPSTSDFWLSEEFISIYNTAEYKQLSLENKKTLSQKEFCLLCSITATGEKEAIININKILLKKKYSKYFPYIYRLIQEELNHIYMFKTFSEKYGTFYPILYSYAQGDITKSQDINELAIFVHLLIFEEVGDIMNNFMVEDETLPELVRVLSQVHNADESRHISFGRKVVLDILNKIQDNIASEELITLQIHLESFIDTRHRDFFNIEIYKSIGIENSFNFRKKLVLENDIEYFIKNEQSKKKILSLLKFLKKNNLISNHRLIS